MDHGRRRRARAARRAVRFLPRCKGRTTKEEEEEQQQQQQQQLVRSSTKCAACLGSTSLVQAGGGLSYYTAGRYLRLVLRAVLVCACAHAVTPSWSSSSSSRSTRPTGPWIDHSPHTLSVVYETGHGVEETQASGTHDDGTTAWRGTLPGQGPRLNWGGQPTCSLARSLTWTAGSPLPCMRCRRFRP